MSQKVLAAANRLMHTQTLLLHIMFMCYSLLLPDVCLKDTMSVADSLYNLQLIKEFCESSLQSCCPLAVEDLLYAPPALHVRIMTVHIYVSVQLGARGGCRDGKKGM